MHRWTSLTNLPIAASPAGDALTLEQGVWRAARALDRWLTG
jgi:hypothetical protein